MAVAQGAGSAPFSASNGTTGVLLLHGFTGTPQSMRPLAEALADAGLSVELPLLPGHGGSLADLSATSFSDWRQAADDAYLGLVSRCDHTVIVGHSMGGTLGCALALSHPDLAGLVLINPLIKSAASEMIETLRAAVAAGVAAIPSIGSDAAKSGVSGGGNDATPIAPLLSLFAATSEISTRLGQITCPVLLFSSRVDHVVPTESGDVLAQGVSGPIERVFLEHSYHLTTLDYDAPEIEVRTVSFVSKLVA